MNSATGLGYRFGMIYAHTQQAPAGLRIAVLALLVLVVAATALAGNWLGLAISRLAAAIVVGAMVIFSRLTIEVTETSIQARFGWGWPRRTITWDEVNSIKLVRNSWWYGFGLRWFPGGTL